MNVFKRNCPACKKYLSNEIIRFEKRGFFKFSRPIVYCPHCYVELKETRKSFWTRGVFAVAQILAVIGVIFYKSAVQTLWYLYFPMILALFLTPIAIFKYEVGKGKISGDNRD